MNSIYIKVGLRFKLENNVYIVSKRLPNSTIEALDEKFNDSKIFTLKELAKYLSTGLLKFEVKGRNVANDISAGINTKFEFDDIKNVKHNEQAIFRYEVIKPIIDIPYNQRKFSDIETRVKEVNSLIKNPKIAQENLGGSTFLKEISVPSVYRWLKYYDDANGDIRALIPSYSHSGSKDIPRISQKVIDFIYEAINDSYLSKQRISINDLRSIVFDKIIDFNEYSSSKLKCPHKATFARQISKIPEYELVAKRIGKRSAENNYDPLGEGVITKYPLERVEIDHTLQFRCG